MLARRLGAFAEGNLRPVTGGGENDTGDLGAWPGGGTERAAPAALCLCPAGYVALG